MLTSDVSEPSMLALLQSETHHHLTVARLSSYRSILKTTAGQVLGWPHPKFAGRKGEKGYFWGRPSKTN